MLVHVTEYFAKMLKVTSGHSNFRNDILEYGVCKSLLVFQCRPNYLYLIRSTSESRPNSIEGKNVCPPVRTSVRPSVRTSVRPQKVSSI